MLTVIDNVQELLQWIEKNPNKQIMVTSEKETDFIAFVPIVKTNKKASNSHTKAMTVSNENLGETIVYAMTHWWNDNSGFRPGITISVDDSSFDHLN